MVKQPVVALSIRVLESFRDYFVAFCSVGSIRQDRLWIRTSISPLGLMATNFSIKVVYFFQAAVLFRIENRKFWPIFAFLLQYYALIGVLLQA